MAFWVLLSVLVLLHNTGGLLGAQVGSSIVDGNDAEPNAWNWMAYLKINSLKKNEWGCGATILGERWVMSAKSCWMRNSDTEPKLKDVVLFVGLVDLQNDAAQYLGIDSNPTMHPKADLVLFRTKDQIKMNGKVGMINLPTKKKLGDTSLCWILGWGDIKKGKSLDNPQKLQQRKIAVKDCKDKRPGLSSKLLCTEDYACDGDYGGPLVCKQDNLFVQVGIMSDGDCNPNGPPGVYTPMYEYADWVRQYLKVK